LDNQSLQLLYLEDMVGSETDSAVRVRNHRAKQKLLKEKERLLLQCNTEVTEGNLIDFSGNTEKENIEKKETNNREKGEGEAEEIPTHFVDPVLNSMFLSYMEYRKECGKEVKGKAIDYCRIVPFQIEIGQEFFGEFAFGDIFKKPALFQSMYIQPSSAGYERIFILRNILETKALSAFAGNEGIKIFHFG